jgi:hypothetical protein
MPIDDPSDDLCQLIQSSKGGGKVLNLAEFQNKLFVEKLSTRKFFDNERQI